MKPFMVLAAGLVLVLGSAGGFARAAPPSEPSFPNDSNPNWARNARYVAFDREQAVTHIQRAMVVPVGHGGVWWVADGHVRGWYPGGESFLVESDGATKVYATDGVDVGTVPGVAASWSTSGGRIAFRRDGALFVADPDGENARRIADWGSPQSWDLTGPVWSPDEQEIAFADGPKLEIAETDGSGARTIFARSNQSVNPSWSSDSRTVAFENNDGPHWTIWTVNTKTMGTKQFSSGLANDRFPQYAPVGDRISFISDRQHVRGEASQFKYSLYLQRGGYSRPTMLLADVHPSSVPRWSPTAAQIAVAAGRECLRWGIYIVSPDPVRSRRATNDCHVDGTARNDILRGRPPFDIIKGYGGNDTIYARDGLRDRIDCGSGIDTAYVDAIDFVVHCERVHGK